MKNRLISIIIVCFLTTVGFLGFITFESSVVSAGNIWYVGSGAGNDSFTIQGGIDLSSDGDTVYVYSGTYNENVVVNKTINLTGENMEFTIINGVLGSETVQVNANWVNITGFTITGGSGIVGLRLSSDYNTISDNKFSVSIIGIYLQSSIGNNITGNIMSENGIYIEGDQLEHWNTHNINISNTVNGKPIYYWKNRTNGLLSSGGVLDAGQVILANCTNITVEAWVITNVCVGILLGFSSNNNIISNSIYSSRFHYGGISLRYSNGNNIMGNFVDNSRHHGLYLNDSSRNIISGNTFSNTQNGNGIHIINSNGNYITDNTVSSNFNVVCGIWLENSNGNYIIGNNVSSNYDGILLHAYSSNNTIENNTIEWSWWRGIDINGYSLKNTVKNNQIHWSGYYGIVIIASNETNILSNNISHSGRHGIWIDGSQRSIITDNTIFSNRKNGINIIEAHENQIFDNNITSNDESGIYFDQSTRNTIYDNNITNNKNGMYLYELSNKNIITDNIISSNNYEGILVEDSSNTKIMGNDISNNLRGVNLSTSLSIFKTSFNIITGNNITSNELGIRLSMASNNTITGNNVSLNSLDGIRLLSSSNMNSIIGNTVFSNGDYGFYLNDSSNNSIYHNNIINNSKQAYDNYSNGNQWDNGYPSGGNYWSNFDESSEGAYDEYNGLNQLSLGSDGIVDNGTIGGGGKNPYVIDSDSQDNYPLIEPNKNYMFLKQGWNLISIPLAQQEQGLTKVLAAIDGLYDAVQWYNITDSSDPWKHNKVGKPFGNDLFELNESIGFWIYITQPGDTIFFYNGTMLLPNQKIGLHPGWNLVGYPSQTSYNRTDGLNNLTFGTHVDAIQWYDSNAKIWNTMDSDDFFVPGRGYWIHSKVDTNWEVPL
jgi:parallel beta-helix repeat protein